jgi:hypothetical protein
MLEKKEKLGTSILDNFFINVAKEVIPTIPPTIKNIQHLKYQHERYN